MDNCICRNWVRTFGETLLSEHHPDCEFRNIELEAKEHILNLIKALEYEGSMGDGISEDFYDDYEKAKFFVNLKVEINKEDN